MLTMQQSVNRPLECVWTLSGERLRCAWVERARPAQAEERRQEAVADTDRKVA
jgi:hypothetical protein